ncbi:class A beta-lactamase [Kribbella sp. CA-293567]|uniref:class A beta-lactamase n=1 Tax=Kribbella sp. CA-293567 TaxID=3002436 RepID=UPI0022DE4E29|nr:class A beta-lactamase [Kribbella sp. CA-293567]WBQ06557.1 class A beta-lactamase [Kribbella sp. CA-293567]
MRRAFLAALTALVLTTSACSSEPAPTAAPPPAPTPVVATAPLSTPTPTTTRQFSKLEKQYAARLGVFALDTGSRRTVSYRADERFAFASTIKALACGVLLDRAKNLDKLIRYTEADLVTYSPITEKHVATGMTLRELCDAAVRYSDNTAANLILVELGGPAGLQTSLRRMGDRVTNSNRNEPTLNEAVPGDVRDTSTPRALAGSLQKLTLGRTLPPPKRAILVNWLRTNTTGDTTIRAGVPKDWKVGDKTGTAGYGSRNDIAILWPPNRAPIVLAVLTTKGVKDAKADDALIAAAAREVVAVLR